MRQEKGKAGGCSGQREEHGLRERSKHGLSWEGWRAKLVWVAGGRRGSGVGRGRIMGSPTNHVKELELPPEPSRRHSSILSKEATWFDLFF